MRHVRRPNLNRPQMSRIQLEHMNKRKQFENRSVKCSDFDKTIRMQNTIPSVRPSFCQGGAAVEVAENPGECTRYVNERDNVFRKTIN